MPEAPLQSEPDLHRERIHFLAGLPLLNYQRERKSAAADLGLRVSDLDAMIRAEHLRSNAERATMDRLSPTPVPGETRWPFGFSMRADGLYGPANESHPPRWLAGRFDVIGHARDHDGEGWGFWLCWNDMDGALHRFMLPAALTVTAPGQLEAELLSRGLRVSADLGDRTLLRRALAEVRSGDRVRIARTTGWLGGDGATAYLLPDGTVLGDAAETFILHPAPVNAAQRCAEAGTLEGWQRDVAMMAHGNPLATFCMGAALAGPLLQIMGETGGGFHLFGGSKRGKTLAVQMGLSAWGLPTKAGGALRDWRGTANALEAVSEESTDGLLALDELHQANPAEVASAAYQLADGAGKRRLNRDSSAARVRLWRAFVLSTGELDLASAVARGGQTLPAGADVRLPSVPVDDATLTWPDLHGAKDFPTFASGLHGAMRVHHGTAARVFITRLAAERATNLDQVEETIRAIQNRFAEALPGNADPQVRDVVRRCALVAAAGELAVAWRLLPWPPGASEDAAFVVFRTWMARRPGRAGSAEAATQLEQVRKILIQHGGSRFTVLEQSPDGRWSDAYPERPVINRIGWRRRGSERDEFLIPMQTWKSEVCGPAGIDPTATARTVHAAGFLRTGGTQSDRSVKERLPGLGNSIRLYAISAAVLEAPMQSGSHAT